MAIYIVETSWGDKKLSKDNDVSNPKREKRKKRNYDAHISHFLKKQFNNMEDLEEVGEKIPQIRVWEGTGHSKSVERIRQDGWKAIQTEE